MIGRARSMAMEKPRFWASATMAVFMPTTWPAALTSGPPELPGLMAASVWMRPSRATPSAVEVAVLGRHDAAGDGGLAAEVEGVADGDHLVADLEVVGRAELGGHEVVDVLAPGSRRGRRRASCRPGWPGARVPSGSTTVMSPTLPITWALVSTRPSALRTMPGAGALEDARRRWSPLVSMATTDGCTLARIAWMSSAPSLVVTGVTHRPVDRRSTASSSRATVTPVATSAATSAAGDGAEQRGPAGARPRARRRARRGGAGGRRGGGARRRRRRAAAAGGRPASTVGGRRRGRRRAPSGPLGGRRSARRRPGRRGSGRVGRLRAGSGSVGVGIGAFPWRPSSPRGRPIATATARRALRSLRMLQAFWEPNRRRGP